MNVASWVWIATVVGLMCVLALDLAIIGRRPHEPSLLESATWVGIYVGLAVAFGLGIWTIRGGVSPVSSTPVG